MVSATIPPDMVNTAAMATVYPTVDQQGGGDAGPWSEPRLHIGDETPGRGLRPGELGHGEGEEHHGQPGGEDGERGGACASCFP